MARTGVHPYRHLSCAECKNAPTRNRSRWCASCAKRQQKTRHPSGKLPRRVIVTPWLQRSRRALVDWGLQYEPGVQQVVDAVRSYLSTTHTHAGTERQLRVMRNHNADPVQVLARFMAVQGLYYHGARGDSMHTDAVFWCALGRCVQRAAEVPNRSRHPVTGKRMNASEGSGLVAETIGHDLACRIGAACRLLWERIEAEEAIRLTEHRVNLDLIARHPDLAKEYPDSKSRRKLARQWTAQRKAYAAKLEQEHVDQQLRARQEAVDAAAALTAEQNAFDAEMSALFPD